MVQNKALIFAKAPNGWPVAGEHLKVKDIGFDESADAPPNGLTLEIHSLSYDPYLRGRMREPHVKSYLPPFDLDQPIVNRGIGKVLKSNNPNFAPGDKVVGYVPFVEYTAIDEASAKGLTKIHNPHKVGEKYFLGPLGMPGITAYSSFNGIGKAKKGETILVSSASGAVGQLVGQYAKLAGLKVLGSVGSDEKLEWITKTLGFDGGFNYKKEKAEDAIARLAPDGLDIYYDNVGGEQLDAAIAAMRKYGRIIACGMISQYSAKEEERYGVKNLQQIVGKSVTMRGFMQSDDDMSGRYWDEMQETVGKWLADGTLKAQLHETKGIDNGAEGFIGHLRGDGLGKAILVLKDE